MVVFLNDLPTAGGLKRRRVDILCGFVLHRFGDGKWWPDGEFTYPATKEVALDAGVPWRPELVGRVYAQTPQGKALFATEVMGWSRHPYTFDLWDGGVYQTSPLSVRTPHAGYAANRRRIGICVTGNFLKRRASETELEVLDGLLASLCWSLRLDPLGTAADGFPVIAGHDELGRGSTATPGKTCPGPGLDVKGRRRSVSAAMLQRQSLDLAMVGVVQ